MSFLNIIFTITCYPIILIMYFMLRNAKDKNGYCFGATLSKELKNDPAVEVIDIEYRKKLKTSMIVLAIIPIAAFFMKHISLIFSLWMYWILAVCFYPMVLFAKANKKIRELKEERGWEQVSEVSYTDLKFVTVPRKVKFIAFLPAMILSAVPVVLSYVVFQEEGFVAIRICLIVFALCTLMFYAFAVLTDRQKMSVISEDSDTNMNFARAKKQIWKNFWLICTWVNTAFIWFAFAGMYFRHRAITVLLWGTVAYGIGTIFVVMWAIKKINELNRKYESKKSIVDTIDDDRHWPYGMMYYNPKDTHVMVENRMGTGTAMNMATGLGKGMYIFAALCLLIIPLSSIWIFMLDFTPIQTTVVDEKIICTHLSVEYEIPLDDIEEYTVITELPEMTKVAGNGMNHVLSGTYEIYREGTFETFLNPQNNLFIKIETADEMYYISGVDNAETQKIIDELEK